MAAFSSSLPSQARVCVCERERESQRWRYRAVAATASRHQGNPIEWMELLRHRHQTDEARAEPTGCVGTVILSLLPLSVLDRFPCHQISVPVPTLSLPPRPFGMGADLQWDP